MKKLFILIAAVGITTNAFALYVEPGLGGGTTGIMCYINNCPARYAADGSCDTICEWCTGSATTPTGYVIEDGLGLVTTSVKRYVTVVCDDFNNTYACVCSDKSHLNQDLQLQTMKCDTGYYGTPSYTYTQRFPSGYTDSFTGCTRCPSSGGVYGTSAAGSTAITDCYIPAGDISWTDDTGTYVCGEDSYYSN